MSLVNKALVIKKAKLCYTYCSPIQTFLSNLFPFFTQEIDIETVSVYVCKGKGAIHQSYSHP